MSKHTPGPWSAPTNEWVTGQPLATGYIWAEEPHGGILAVVYRQENGNTRDEQRLIQTADAHLIAAAPDMLEAIHAAIDYLSQPADDGEGRANMKLELMEVVEKAEGKRT